MRSVEAIREAAAERRRLATTSVSGAQASDSGHTGRPVTHRPNPCPAAALFGGSAARGPAPPTDAQPAAQGRGSGCRDRRERQATVRAAPGMASVGRWRPAVVRTGHVRVVNWAGRSDMRSLRVAGRRGSALGHCGSSSALWRPKRLARTRPVAATASPRLRPDATDRRARRSLTAVGFGVPPSSVSPVNPLCVNSRRVPKCSVGRKVVPARLGSDRIRV